MVAAGMSGSMAETPRKSVGLGSCMHAARESPYSKPSGTSAEPETHTHTTHS